MGLIRNWMAALMAMLPNQPQKLLALPDWARRERKPGKPLKAGSKLARKAAKGRISIATIR